MISSDTDSLLEVDVHFGLTRPQDETFFPEWRGPLSELTASERAAVNEIYQRLSYHRANSNLLEGTVTLLVASPLLEAIGFYDPPFQIRAEAAIELRIDDREETLRGRIDILILQEQFWALVLESKKTTISARANLPQALAYMLANPKETKQPLFGCLTNGDEIVFIKLAQSSGWHHALSRGFSLYTDKSEMLNAVRVLKRLKEEMLQNV